MGPPRSLRNQRFDTIARSLAAHAGAQAWDRALEAARPLLEEQRRDPDLAASLLQLVDEGTFGRCALDVAKAVFESHSDDANTVIALANLFPTLHDINYLNAEPPADPFFAAIASRLQSLTEAPASRQTEIALLQALAQASRLLGRKWDKTAESAAQQVVRLTPERWHAHYNLGLFYKTRGRFAEGLAANQRAVALGGGEDESALWNLGICATGAGDGEAALGVWKKLDQIIEPGRFGLPEGRYPATKVRLAQRPLAQRDPTREPDDPGREETIWVERLSPCHGIVRSAIYYDEIGVDFGDVVLFDGAAITHHKYGDRDVPVFPHLTTLRRGRYTIFRFAGTQRQERQIASLSERLPEDAVLYVHTEQVALVCASCWANPGTDHARHASTDHRVIRGKLCAPPTVDARDLLRALDNLLEQTPEIRVVVPALARAAGQIERADVEERRIAMLESAES
jgi:hypothetical protein